MVNVGFKPVCLPLSANSQSAGRWVNLTICIRWKSTMDKGKCHVCFDEMTGSNGPVVSLRSFMQALNRKGSRVEGWKSWWWEPFGQSSPCWTLPSWRGEVTAVIPAHPCQCPQVSQHNSLAHVDRACWQIYDNQQGNLTLAFWQE